MKLYANGILLNAAAQSVTLEKSRGDAAATLTAVLLTAAVCLVCSMNDMAVPSVSLEGKTLWISRSLPVDAWTALRAKCGVQLLLTAPGAVFAAVCSAIALRAGFAAGLLMALCCAAKFPARHISHCSRLCSRSLRRFSAAGCAQRARSGLKISDT